MFDDELVYRFTPIQPPFDEEAAARRIEAARRGEGRGSFCARAVVVDGASAGEVAAFSRPVAEGPDPAVSISYVIGSRFRGRHLARAATELFINDLNEMWSIRRFIAEISPDNPASEKVAASLGFVPEAGAEPVQRQGKTYSVVPWTLLKL